MITLDAEAKALNCRIVEIGLHTASKHLHDFANSTRLLETFIEIPLNRPLENYAYAKMNRRGFAPVAYHSEIKRGFRHCLSCVNLVA